MKNFHFLHSTYVITLVHISKLFEQFQRAKCKCFESFIKNGFQFVFHLFFFFHIYIFFFFLMFWNWISKFGIPSNGNGFSCKILIISKSPCTDALTDWPIYNSQSHKISIQHCHRFWLCIPDECFHFWMRNITSKWWLNEDGYKALTMQLNWCLDIFHEIIIRFDEPKLSETARKSVFVNYDCFQFFILFLFRSFNFTNLVSLSWALYYQILKNACTSNEIEWYFFEVRSAMHCVYSYFINKIFLWLCTPSRWHEEKRWKNNNIFINNN